LQLHLSSSKQLSAKSAFLKKKKSGFLSYAAIFKLPLIMTVKLNDFSMTFHVNYLQSQRLMNSMIIKILTKYKTLQNKLCPASSLFFLLWAQ